MDRYTDVMRKPKGVKEAPMTDMFFELYGDMAGLKESHSHHGGSIA